MHFTIQLAGQLPYFYLLSAIIIIYASKIYKSLFITFKVYIVDKIMKDIKLINFFYIKFVCKISWPQFES